MFSGSCFLPITWTTCIPHQEPSEKHWIPHLPSRLPSPLDCACIPRTHRPTVPVTHVTSPLDYRSGLTRSKARPAIKTRLTSHSLTSQQSPSHPQPTPPTALPPSTSPNLAKPQSHTSTKHYSSTRYHLGLKNARRQRQAAWISRRIACALVVRHRADCAYR
jgi:hypothetical protein